MRLQLWNEGRQIVGQVVLGILHFFGADIVVVLGDYILEHGEACTRLEVGPVVQHLIEGIRIRITSSICRHGFAMGYREEEFRIWRGYEMTRQRRWERKWQEELLG